MKVYYAVMGWLSRLFINQQVQDVMGTAATMIDHVTPIIVAIEKDLKPGLQNNTLDNKLAIRHFLETHAYDYFDIFKLVDELYDKPYIHIITSVALAMAQRLAPAESTSVIRLALELAYNIYKVTR